MSRKYKPPISFAKYSVAGNTTLFVARPGYVERAMEIIPAEQACYVDVDWNKIKMLGGEFCLNAALAYAAINKIRRNYPAALAWVAGIKVELTCCGKEPQWVAKAKFSSKICQQRQTEFGPVVTIPGISHLLLKRDELPDRETALAEGKELISRLRLNEEPAAGVIWWRQGDSRLEILPLVSVPGAGTLNFEAACGSGSVALSYSLGNGKYETGRYDIRQPSGEMLVVKISCGMASIRGTVREVAMGSLWLD